MSILDALFGGLALGLWGWLAFVAMSGIIIWAQEYEVEGPSIFSILGFGVIVWLLNYGFSIPAFSSVIGFVAGAAWKLLIFGLVYAAVGGVWAIVKWFFFLHNKADEYALVRSKLATAYANALANGQDGIEGTNWRSYTGDDFKKKYPTIKDYLVDQGYPPSPLKNKLRIYSWMMYWPWSALWTLAKDPAKYLWKLVYTAISELMTTMSKYVFGNRFEEFR